MQFLDFMYDGQYLSDYGFMIATFNKSATKTVIGEGSKITFNKYSRYGGSVFPLKSAVYEKTYTTTFDICKNPKINKDIRISSDEYRDIVRWLNRKQFLQFCFIPMDGDETEKYYNASFNVKKIIINNKLVGISLTLETDSAIGYGQQQTIIYNVSETDKVFTLSDISDDVGFIYPDVEIEIKRAGDFRIYSLTYDETTEIKNCSAGENIKLKGSSMIILSDDENHSEKLSKDFNFNFLKIGNTINNRQNKLKFSLPCKVKITYKPNIK